MDESGGQGAAAPPLPPAGLRPMHPTASRTLPLDEAHWAFEAKWDGYRALAHAAGGQVRLRSRNGVDMTGWFPELAGLGAALPDRAAVLDGEVVALDGRGRPDFEGLQRRMSTRAALRRGRRPVAFLAFDLLWLDGRVLCPLPYAERRLLLDGLELAGPAWQTVASFPGEGTALLAATRAQGLEGVVAKRLDSPYLPGRRSRLWLKVKHYQREAFVVGGFVPGPAGGGSGGLKDRPPVEVVALLVGSPEPGRPGRLRFAGRIDHGLVPAARRRLAARLAAMRVEASPFVDDPAALAGGRWRRASGAEAPPVFVRPELTVEVTFLGWEAGRLRHAALGRLG
ncbi:MAG TPA: non-homologous end-joining DNA ligase [Actinomycetota bacterium]|nr:non-homologous end-joining DNA ligase [Actinomycetota bacterium]